VNKSLVSEKRAWYERGFHAGRYDRGFNPPDDVAAAMLYAQGFRIGKREKERAKEAVA
jgi:hypothetical protein